MPLTAARRRGRAGRQRSAQTAGQRASAGRIRSRRWRSRPPTSVRDGGVEPDVDVGAEAVGPPRLARRHRVVDVHDVGAAPRRRPDDLAAARAPRPPNWPTTTPAVGQGARRRRSAPLVDARRPRPGRRRSGGRAATERRGRSSGPQMPSAVSPQLRWKSHDAACGLGAEDAVDPPGVEPEPAEPALELGDVVTAQRGASASSRRRSPSAHDASTRAAQVVLVAAARRRAARGSWNCRPRPRCRAAVTRRAACGGRAGNPPAPRRRCRSRTASDRVGLRSAGEVDRNSSSSSSSWPLPLAPTRRFVGSPVVEHDAASGCSSRRTAGRWLRVLVDVELGDRDLARLLGGDLAEDRVRSSCTARTTRPRSRRRRACCSTRTVSSKRAGR